MKLYLGKSKIKGADSFKYLESVIANRADGVDGDKEKTTCQPEIL